MKTEKIVISFISIFFGLIVAGVTFYLYQATKTVTPTKLTVTAPTTTPTAQPFKSTAFVTLDTPTDEQLVSNKTLTITGKTRTDATIIVITPVDQQIVTPAKNGSFSVTTTITDNENLIKVTAIEPQGDQASVTRTVTYSTQSF